MNNKDITFIIFTYNEASRIERVIKNFESFGNILLADNNSTDGTVDIAKQYGCKIFLRKEDYAFVENQQLVEQLYQVVDTEWIYWGFADEMLDGNTLNMISEIIKSNSYDIISMNRKNYSHGVFCYDLFHGYNYKAWKKGAIDFVKNPIHGMGKATVANEKIYKMPDRYFIHHFSSYTAKSYINTLNRYTDTEVEFCENYDTSLYGVIKQFIKRILKNYLFDGGYKAGYAGLGSVLMTLSYEWMRNIKIYEKQNGLNRDVIESKNNIIRDDILAKLDS